MSQPRFPVKRLTPTATIPKRGSAQAAGYDLYADQAGTVPPCSYTENTIYKEVYTINRIPLIIRDVSVGKLLVSTGIAVKIPEGYYGRVAPRSGLAVKNNIDIGAGVIDSDYRGEVKVLLFNFGSQPFEFKTGDRIAQLILEKITTPEPEEVDDLDSTDRGAGGFGSTGVSDRVLPLIMPMERKATDPMPDNEFETFCKTYETDTLEKIKNNIHVSDPFKLQYISREQQDKLNDILKRLQSSNYMSDEDFVSFFREYLKSGNRSEPENMSFLTSSQKQKIRDFLNSMTSLPDA